MTDTAFYTLSEGNWTSEIYKRVFESRKDRTQALSDSLYGKEPKTVGRLPYFPDGCCPHEYFDCVKNIADECGEDIYEVHFVAFLLMCEKMRALYRENGIPESFFENAVSGVVRSGYDYRMNAKYLVGALFRIGSFDFQLCENIYEGFENIGVGEPILKMHIPEGAPFDKKARYESYRDAYGFFSKKTGKKSLHLVCDSWILSHEHREYFPDTNIGSFADDFDIVKGYKQNGYEGAQRIFGKGFSRDFGTLPENTALQRFYKKKMLCSEPLFYGVGAKLMTEEEFGKD